MEPAIALIAVALFGGSYVLVFIVARRILARIGDVILQSNNARFKSVHEVMSSIKDVKILGVERPFIKRFCEPRGVPCSMGFAEFFKKALCRHRNAPPAPSPATAVPTRPHPASSPGKP